MVHRIHVELDVKRSVPPAEIGTAQQEIPVEFIFVEFIVFVVATAIMATLAVRGSKV